MNSIVKNSGKYTLGLLFVAAMVLSASGQAFATPFSYGFVPITWNNGNKEMTDGLADNFSMEVEDLGSGKVGFKISSFLNNDVGGDNFSIADIYFYGGEVLDVGQGVEITSHEGVAFSSGKVAPPHLPGLRTDVPLAYAADSDAPVPHNGVKVDEWVSFLFTLGDGESLGDTLGALDAGVMFVGIHVQGFGGFSESFVTSLSSTTPTFPPSPTPVPGAVWLLGSGLLALVGLRRKFRG